MSAPPVALPPGVVVPDSAFVSVAPAAAASSSLSSEPPSSSASSATSAPEEDEAVDPFAGFTSSGATVAAAAVQRAHSTTASGTDSASEADGVLDEASSDSQRRRRERQSRDHARKKSRSKRQVKEARIDQASRAPPAASLRFTPSGLVDSSQHVIDVSEARSRSASSAASASASPPAAYDLSSRGSEALAMAHEHTRRVAEASMLPRRPTPSSSAAARYDTFGETSRVDVTAALTHADDLHAWLATRGFDSGVVLAKLSRSGGDFANLNERSGVRALLPATKLQLKTLLGVGDGIRLFHAVREAQQAYAHLEALAGTGVPSASRPRLAADSFLPSAGGVHRASPTAVRDVPSRGLYGYCSLSACARPANSLCGAKGCERPLCLAHASKSLLSGAILCEQCYATLTYLDDFKGAVGITGLQENGYIAPDAACAIQ